MYPQRIDSSAEEEAPMAWASPKVSKTLVDAAGREFAVRNFPMKNDTVLQTINNWRSSHGFPLNTFQIELRRTAKRIDPDADVVQRIKRLEAIHNKLRLGSGMRLTQMQDIGGCRAVVNSLTQARELVQEYKRKECGPRFIHTFKNEKGYIEAPGPDGYRSHHLIYRYLGRGVSERYNGLNIEIQIRTRLQHAWATAVEVVGTFARQALKSGTGDKDWLRFFSLMGTATAALEGCPSVPGTPTDKGVLVSELRALNESLKAVDTLSALIVSLQVTKRVGGDELYVLQLDYDRRKLKYVAYSKSQRELAMSHANDMEQKIKSGQNIQVVLVAADSFEALRRAYPNYFLDTTYFRDVVVEILNGQFPEPLRVWE